MTNHRKKKMLLFIPVLLLFAIARAQDKEEIVKVNGISVTLKELDREMQRCRSLVISRIVKEYQVNDMTNFWAKSYHGKPAGEILKQKALDTLLFFKVQEQLLKKWNLWRYDTYTELLEDLKKTNASRVKAEKEGKVIYGPVEYTEQSFFDYQFGNSIIRLKEKLVAEKVLQADEAKLRMQFEKMKKTVYKNNEKMDDYRKQIHAAYIEEAYTAYINSLFRQAKLKE
ncbi:hypothetical protein [Pseudopedobacter sp.]|uniref:hypothetical protein n=1 Tax=Pseudopedobacter sp. TaxID=1936787 RepID=UPI00333F3DDD